MHFEDLQLCHYHPGRLDAAAWAVPLRAIGWLEDSHSFAVGLTPEPIVLRLGLLLDQTRQHFPHYRFRGSQVCSLCRAAGRSTGGAGWSQENLVVPGVNEIYAAPGGITHYISDHSYRPPAAFLDAVASCPDCGSDEYFEALCRANGGRNPPVESFKQFRQRCRSSTVATQTFIRALGMPIMQATRAQVIAAARAVWPDTSFSPETCTLELAGVTVVFDDAGRVVRVAP